MPFPIAFPFFKQPSKFYDDSHTQHAYTHTHTQTQIHTGARASTLTHAHVPITLSLGPTTVRSHTRTHWRSGARARTGYRRVHTTAVPVSAVTAGHGGARTHTHTTHGREPTLYISGRTCAHTGTARNAPPDWPAGKDAAALAPDRRPIGRPVTYRAPAGRLFDQ